MPERDEGYYWVTWNGECQIAYWFNAKLGNGWMTLSDYFMVEDDDLGGIEGRIESLGTMEDA